MKLLLFIIPLVGAFFIGKILELRHYRSIRDREKKFLKLPAVTIKNAIPNRDDVEKSWLVTGSVVISLDYFKRFIAAINLVFGGRLITYESLLDRARREAILRMKQMARGADLIVNVRLETSVIGENANQKKQIGSIEAMAYGTAVRKIRKKKA